MTRNCVVGKQILLQFWNKKSTKIALNYKKKNKKQGVAKCTTEKFPH